MFLVVDIINIGIGWRFIRSYILIVNVMKIKRTNSVRFLLDRQIEKPNLSALCPTKNYKEKWLKKDEARFTIKI